MSDDPAIRYFQFTHRNGTYHQVIAEGPGTARVEVTLSPTGRSIHVWVNGHPWSADE